MTRCAHRPIVARLQPLLPALVLLASAGIAASASAQSVDVVRVEEDWELVVDSADPSTTAPQVVCVTSPVSHVDQLHMTFQLNHHNDPDFVPGGMQLQLWSGEEPVTSRKFSNTATMASASETVQWTQAVEVKDGLLTFEVVNGSSITWGSFGEQGSLRATVASPVTNLNQYDPDVSSANSGVSYAGNKVKSLALKRVRVYLASGTILQDDTLRIIDLQ